MSNIPTHSHLTLDMGCGSSKLKVVSSLLSVQNICSVRPHWCRIAIDNAPGMQLL